MHIPAHGISKGKIGVLIEDHFDMTEFRIFNKRIPEAGFDLIYMSDLWNNSSLQFGSNPDNGWGKFKWFENNIRHLSWIGDNLCKNNFSVSWCRSKSNQ